MSLKQPKQAHRPKFSIHLIDYIPPPILNPAHPLHAAMSRAGMLNQGRPPQISTRPGHAHPNRPRPYLAGNQAAHVHASIQMHDGHWRSVGARIARGKGKKGGGAAQFNGTVRSHTRFLDYTSCGFRYRQRYSKAARRDPYLVRLKAEGKPMPYVWCLRPAGWGTTHYGYGWCQIHEKQAKLMAQTAQVQAVIETIRAKQQVLGLPIAADPHEILITELHRTAGVVAWLEERIKEIGDESEDKVLHQYTAMGIQPSNWMKMYQDERKHLVQVAATCIKAGIAERQVKLAEEQGKMLAMVLQAFIHDPRLGLTPAQLQNAPTIIRAHLLSLPQSAVQDSTEDLGLGGIGENAVQIESPAPVHVRKAPRSSERVRERHTQRRQAP